MCTPQEGLTGALDASLHHTRGLNAYLYFKNNNNRTLSKNEQDKATALLELNEQSRTKLMADYK